MTARRRMPDCRRSVTRHFHLWTPSLSPSPYTSPEPQPGAEVDVYATVGLYDDGTPGELFLRVAKQGDDISGLADLVGRMTSLALQHGCPLETVLSHMRGTKFPPCGRVDGRFATSLADAVARWIEEAAPRWHVEAAAQGGPLTFAAGAAST